MSDFWSSFLTRHGGKLIFSALGLIFGLTVLAKGLFAACFLFLCLGAGYMVGKRIDEGERLTSWLEKILPF